MDKMVRKLRSFSNGIHGEFFESVAKEIISMKEKNTRLHATVSAVQDLSKACLLVDEC